MARLLQVLFSVCLFAAPCDLSADEAEDTLKSIADSHTQIVREYATRMHAAQRSKASQQELLEIGRWRRDALNRMILRAETHQVSALSASDLAAVAVSCEVLRRSEDCIRYARLALERDPADETVYRPLIRSLLNTDRVGEAEEAVAAAEEHIPDLVKWRGMHYFLFVKSRHNQDWDRAVSHLVIFMDRQVEVIDQGPRQAVVLRSKLDDFIAACQQAGRSAEAEQRLNRYLRQCSAAIQDARQSETVSREQLAHTAALCELRCRLAILLPDASVEEQVLNWWDDVFSSRWDELETQADRYRLYVVRYVQKNAEHIEDWEALAAGLPKPGSPDTVNGLRRRDTALIADQLATFVHSRRTVSAN